MIDVSIALLFNLMAMAAIGVGPSLYLLSGKDRWAAALGISPATGFVLTCLLGTYLTVLDCPVSRGATLVLVAGMFVSIVLTLLAIAPGTIAKLAIDRKLLIGVAAFCVVCLLSMAPQVVGGLRYSILRGNGTDSFNYITAAGYLDHQPYSWASHTGLQSLVDRHPSYELAHQLLTSRWSTFMMLALTSRIGGVPPYKFEYFFSVLCFLISFGPVYLYCSDLLDLPPICSALAAIAICAGFWAQLILDLRADSQQCSIPALLLLIFVIGRMEADRRPGIWRREVALVALAAASLTFFYPEIVPLATLGVGLFLAVRLLDRRAAFPSAVRLAAAACLTLIAVIPVWRTLLAFGLSQMKLAAHSKNDWEKAYFPWLYASPLSGLWGFGPLPEANAFLHLICVLLAAVISAAFVAAVARFVSPAGRTRPGAVLAATMAAAALMQWGYLCYRGQLWAAGKGLSFGYPFLMMCVIGYAFQRPKERRGWRNYWAKCVAVSVSAMLLVQGAYAASRPFLAWLGHDYPNYIAGHGEYRRHDWNPAPFARVFRSGDDLTVWSNMSNPWVADYLGLVFGWDVHLVNIGTSRDIEERHAPRQTLDRPPQYLFVEDSFSDPAFPGANTPAANNAELSLYKLPDHGILLTNVKNPNGMEGPRSSPFFWLGGPATVVSVVSTTDGCSLLSGRFSIGPSNPELKSAHLTVDSDAGGGPQHCAVIAGQARLRLRTRRGLNRITIQVDEPPLRFLANDPRPLVLRMDDLRIQEEACEANGR